MTPYEHELKIKLEEKNKLIKEYRALIQRIEANIKYSMTDESIFDIIYEFKKRGIK